MSGTPEGAARAKATEIAKYGSEEAWLAELKKRSAKGGSKRGITKGFGTLTPEQRAEYGRKGGTLSRRTSKKNVSQS